MKRSRKTSPVDKQADQGTTNKIHFRKSSEKKGQMTYLNEEIIEDRILQQNYPSSVRNLHVPAMFNPSF